MLEAVPVVRSWVLGEAVPAWEQVAQAVLAERAAPSASVLPPRARMNTHRL